MQQFSHKVPGEYLYDGMVLGNMHPKHIIDKVPDFDMTGDLLLATYPKTGTTWMQELIWLLCNDGDTARARTSSLNDRFPHIEFALSTEGPYEYDQLLKQSSPRLIKTHLPVQFFLKQLEKGLKVVVTIRNPKDTMVSLYHFYRMNALLGNFEGTWNEFFEMFKAKHMYFGDFFDWYMDWWALHDNPNVLFVKYEDMKMDLKKVLAEVGAFLGKTITERKLDEVLKHLQFSNMKDNGTVNFRESTILKQDVSAFMRKGIIGDWKNYFNKEQSEFMDYQYKATLEKAGLCLKFE